MKTTIRKISRWIYALFAAAFLVGVLVQVFFAGMAAVARISGWDNHIGLGHLLGAPLGLMLLSMFPAKLAAREKWLTFLLVIVYVLQADVIIFMRDSAPYLAAAHPVLALFDFLIGQELVRQAFRSLRGPDKAAADRPGKKSLGRQVAGEA